MLLKDLFILLSRAAQLLSVDLRAQGIRVESLAIVESMDAKTGEVVFRD